MKEIKSKVQPNHMECSVWIDLNEDPHGSVKKYWNGVNWIKSNSNDNSKQFAQELNDIKQTIKELFIELGDVRKTVAGLNNYDDTKVHDRINKLINRVKKIEEQL